MRINNGIKMSVISAVPRYYRRTELVPLRKNMPEEFKFTRAFELAGKSIVMQKGFQAETADAIRDALIEHSHRLSLLNEDNVCIIGDRISEKTLVELGFSSRIFNVPLAAPPEQAKAEIVSQIIAASAAARENSLHIMLQHEDPSCLTRLRPDVVTAIKKTIDPAGYCVAKIRGALGGKYDNEQLENAACMVPDQVARDLTAGQLACVAENLIKNEDTGLSVSQIKIQGKNADVLNDVVIIKSSYFGITHDLVSIFAGSGLEPLDITFYPVPDAGKLICRCRARYSGSKTGVTKTEEEMMKLLSQDKIKRDSLPDEGSRLWFSFVGLYNAMARLKVSMDGDASSAGSLVETMKSHPDIMKAVLSELRVWCDRDYKAEAEAVAEDIPDAGALVDAIGDLDGKDAAVMKFCLDFVRSVRKTDYFDANRLKEVSNFLLRCDAIKEYLDGSAEIRPEELVYLYRRSQPLKLSPIYTLEKKTRSERFSEPLELDSIKDPVARTMIAPSSSRVKSASVDIISRLMPWVGSMTNKELSIFERMRFIDVNGRESNISGIRPQDYFSLAAGALFSRVRDDGVAHEEEKYLFDIARMQGLRPADIDRVSIKFLGEGDRRNVSTVKLYAGGMTRTFIAAVNRTSEIDPSVGQAYKEHKALIDWSRHTGLLPGPFGFTTVPLSKFEVGVLFKEFLRGLDAEQYASKLSRTADRLLFYRKVGNAIGGLFDATGHGSMDFKLGNMVFYDGSIRFCDVSPITDDLGMVLVGFAQLFGEIKQGRNGGENDIFKYKTQLVEGIVDDTVSGREFMGRLRDNMYYDNEDCWESASLLEQLDEIAKKKGKNPSEYYKYVLK